MSNTKVQSPLRAPPRASHLRQVSNGNSDAVSPTVIGSERYNQPDTFDEGLAYTPAAGAKLADRVCILSVHDDSFCRDDVLLNVAHFPKGSVAVGDLAQIVAVKPGTAVRDFQDATPSKPGRGNEDGQASQTQAQESTSGIKRSSLTSVSIGEGNSRASGGRIIDAQKRYVFMVKDMSSDQRVKQPGLQVSVSSQFANTLGFKNRMEVMMSVVDHTTNSASHVEISFRDEYLARSDMWRLIISELSGKTVYKGQKINFMGTIKAMVKTIYFRGQKVQSAYFSGDTKPIFRSESARYVIFIQMSREMWNFDTEGTGEIVFNKVINGFLPELFRRWVTMNARHLVSIILFTRVEYKGYPTKAFRHQSVNVSEPSPSQHLPDKAYQDFFRVVVSEMASGEWATILNQLKKEFRVFLRDVSVQLTEYTTSSKPGEPVGEQHNEHQSPESVIAGQPSSAIHGNILEAINLASTQYATDYIDRDLVRTGISIIVITPGTGLFEVGYDLLKLTNDTLIGNGVGIDLVCLSEMPLHSVPLFKYRNPRVLSIIDNTQPKVLSGDSTPRQKYALSGSFTSQSSSLSASVNSTFGTSLARSYKGSIAPNVAGEWTYAIPHWIDISFWKGADDGRPTGIEEDASTTKKAGMKRKQHKGFVPRCTMYELQMMGIMENEMSNISIPFIHESPFYTQLATAERQAEAGDITKAASSAPDIPFEPKAGIDQQKSESRPSIFTRPDRDHRAPKPSKGTYQWMDDYDAAVYKPLIEFLAAEREARIKDRNIKWNKSHKLRNDDPALLGTSYISHGRSTRGLNAPAGTAYFDRKMEERRSSDEHISSRKSSMSNGTTLTPTLVTKPDRSSRQISFGLRGLGIAAAKAKAELNSEHASLSKPGSMIGAQLPSLSLATVSPGRSHSSSLTSNDVKTALSRPIPSSNRLDMELEKQATNNANQPSRPIAIKSAVNISERSRLGNVEPEPRHSRDANLDDAKEPENKNILQKPSITRKPGSKSDLASKSTAIELPETLSPTSALSPWMTMLNPSNPRNHKTTILDQFRRWQHVFPRPLRTSSIKWKSLCSPAAVPLTTEYFPTAEQLASEYQQSLYNVTHDVGARLPEDPKTREQLLKELTAIRLSQGFQLVVGPAVVEATGKLSSKNVNMFDSDYMANEGAIVFLSMGNAHHQLSRIKGGAVEVKRFVRKPTAAIDSAVGQGAPILYKPMIRTTLAEDYHSRQVILQAPTEEYNWNYVDSFIAGCEEPFTESLRFWRARFVLIPVDPPSSARRTLHPINEDNEEEVRLEGIQRLTQMWKRHEYTPLGERRFQSSTRQKKDINPLHIIYQTKDLSVMLDMERSHSALFEGDPNNQQSQTFPENELFSKEGLNFSTLAQAIQGEKGIRISDRRWHWRLHYNCFIGFDLTTWLLENFKDVDTREEAVTLGNELMSGGLFEHVEKRHQFRDGNFFFQIVPEYRIARPESKSGWFGSRKVDKSAPSTPIPETIRGSPKTDRSHTSSTADDIITLSDTQFPAAETDRPINFQLSRVMRYDVDPRRRSYRPEVINLHYDRHHNPDSCYHIRIDWMNVTAKLIEDAIVLWATTAEKFGLRLVEAPIGEAASVDDIHPFRAPYMVTLAVEPPDGRPQSYFEATSFNPQANVDRFYYQKLILKKFDFVLDMEAATNYPSDIEVRYSWGKPDYKFSQYIHRSGVLFAQITDRGDFLLLANRLYNNRTAAAKESIKFDRGDRSERRPTGTNTAGTQHNFAGVGNAIDQISPFASPLVRATADVFGPGFASSGIGSSFVTPEGIRNELESFCTDSTTLQVFYERAQSKPLSPGSNTPVSDQTIPSLGLPPSLLSRDVSPSPALGPSSRAANGRTSSPQIPRISTAD
ncbi:MAG: vacuolar membrane-associated protein iml1 [Candelina mexicana]|nr:MAG: vacuolar membrane-associated protein iml1 [Candelina mexicana]